MVLGTLIYIIIIIVVIIIIIALLQLLVGLFFVAPMGIDYGDLEIFKQSMISLRPV
jgi:hypothetical protein